MKLACITLTTCVTLTAAAHAQSLTEIAQFAQSICGDVPEGGLTRTEIQAKVQANAGTLAKIVSGDANVTVNRMDEIYKGIPFEKLPDKIPTVAMCKSDLSKAIIERQKKMVANVCRHPDFGQEGWGRTEQYSDSSGRVDGGHDQGWWCNQVAASFIQTRSIGKDNQWERVTSGEESDKDWKGHVTYKYSCTIKVSWDPIYTERQDASRCGTHEE